MEDYSSFPTGKNAARIMRRSIFIFLQNFQYFTSTPSLLLVPFTVSTLLSQPLVASSYLFPLVHGRLRSLFLAAGIPPQSELFAILNLKLSQTILSFLLVFPFAISLLLLAKVSIIRALDHLKPSDKTASFSRNAILIRLLVTKLCNSLVILSANATCFFLLVISFNCSDVLGLSSPRFLLLLSATATLVYSIILAYAYIICNFSLIVSGTENRSGFNSILNACVLIRGRASSALSLVVPINMALAGIESLFQYRVVRAYHRAMAPNASMLLEATLIAYLYAMLLVLDTIVGYVFLKSCRLECQIDQEVSFSHRIEIEKREERSFRKVKTLESVL